MRVSFVSHALKLLGRSPGWLRAFLYLNPDASRVLQARHALLLHPARARGGEGMPKEWDLYYQKLKGNWTLGPSPPRPILFSLYLTVFPFLPFSFAILGSRHFFLYGYLPG